MTNCIVFFSEPSLLGLHKSSFDHKNTLLLIQQFLFKANNCLASKDFNYSIFLISYTFLALYFLNIKLRIKDEYTININRHSTIFYKCITCIYTVFNII